MFHSDSKEWNYAGYENEEFENIIDYAWEIGGTNYSEALSLYRKAQEILFNDVAGINLWDKTRPFIYNTRVELPPNVWILYTCT